MSTVEESFSHLITQIREGSEAAAWQLIELYGPHIHRVVQRHLDRRLRGKFDSIDFVQAVWASFFREPALIRDFRTPAEVVEYLATSARYKVFDEARRRLGSRKHNIRRELSLDDSAIGSDPRIATGPTPDEVAMAREAWDELISTQTMRHQEIVRLRFLGASFPEIAEKLEINERTARKVIDRLLRLKSA